MRALCQSHIERNNYTVWQFFRHAYVWEHNCHPPIGKLLDDVDGYEKHGRLPGYVTSYLSSYYGPM